jgi:uncharacterized ferritin-like protein (DUF455 family)
MKCPFSYSRFFDFTARSAINANRDLIDARAKNKTNIAHYEEQLEIKQAAAVEAGKEDLKVTTCSDDPRPVFFFLQGALALFLTDAHYIVFNVIVFCVAGGTHYGTSPSQFVDLWLRPTLQKVHHYAEHCHNQSAAAGKALKYTMHFAISGVSVVTVF